MLIFITILIPCHYYCLKLITEQKLLVKYLSSISPLSLVKMGLGLQTSVETITIASWM